MTITTVPNDLWRLMPFSSILTVSATCKEMRINAAVVFSTDKEKLGRYISSLLRDQKPPCIEEILHKLQDCATHLDLTITSLYCPLLRKIQNSFLHLKLTLKGPSFTDRSLPPLLAACSKLCALNIESDTQISILGLIDAKLPNTIQKIGGIAHLTKGHSLLALACAAKCEDPMPLASLFVRGYCRLNEVYEEDHIEGRDLMKQVLKLAPKFVDAMVALGTSLLADTEEREDAKMLLQQAITLDPTNNQAQEALSLHF